MTVNISLRTLIWILAGIAIAIVFITQTVNPQPGGSSETNRPAGDRAIAGLPSGLRGVESGVRIQPLRDRESFSEDVLPDDATPLEPGTYGVVGTGPSTRPVAKVISLDCDSQALMRAETSQGTYLIGVAASAPWDCSGAIARWQSAQGDPSVLGVRLDEAVGAAPPMATLIGDKTAVQFAAEGVWRVD